MNQNTPWEHMPFFLVTHTSLVEAQDEQEAAQKGVDRLRSGAHVTVSVKSDETTITQIVVPAMLEKPLPIPPSENASSSLVAFAIPEATPAAPESKKLILRRMMADALALLGRRT